jgi:autotransporter translocation and assembly factor TamB
MITISANALLSDTRFTQDYSLVDIGEQMKKKVRETPKPINPLFNNVIVKLSVNCNSNLTFDSNLGKMLVDGKVSVVGRPGSPQISSEINILNGFVYYLDRKFTVSQGTIRQYDPQRINPLLDLTAISTVSWFPPQGDKKDYDITLLIKGDLANPVITFSASPTLSQPQIISLLTLGTIQTGMGADLGSRTGSLLSQQVAGLGTRKLARFLNVESVDIYGNAFGPSSTAAQLSVTKQVSSRVAVTYSTGLSTLSQQMVMVSYRILSFLYLEAESDQQARGGVDLKFRYSK